MKKSDNVRKKRKVVIVIAAFIIIAVIAGCYFYDTNTLAISDFLYDLFYGGRKEQPVTVDYAEGDLIIHFVDVGQGDSIIIQFPDNKNMIIDGGPRSAKKALLAYIDNLKITTFDYLLLTHSDEDHCGSLDDVILNYEIKTIYMPDISVVTGELIGTAVYKNFITAAKNEKFTDEENNKQNAKIMSSDSIYSDFSGVGYSMDFVTPNIEDYNIFKSKKPNAEGLNSISPIMVLTFSDKKIMFTGDANEKTEEVFLKNIKGKEKDYNVDILKVGHHGSKTSTSLDFLGVVKPEVAVIEVGAGNKYGHPTQELLTRLKTYTGGLEKIYRTDLNGDIIFKITSDGNKAEILDPVFGKPASSSSVTYIKISKDFSECLSCVFISVRKVF